MPELREGVIADADALTLLAFLVTSAEGCLKEPPLYGVFRLSTAAIKLAAAWEPHASAETAAVLRDLIANWDREAALLSRDTRQLKRHLEAASVAVVGEIQRRQARQATS